MSSYLPLYRPSLPIRPPEKLVFLFLDVLLHHLTEYPDLSIIEFLLELHRFNFIDQILHGGMFNNSFVEQIVILGGLASFALKLSSSIWVCTFNARQIFSASSALRRSSSSSSYSSNHSSTSRWSCSNRSNALLE